MKYYITFYQDFKGQKNLLRKFRIERLKDAKESLKRFEKEGFIRAAWITCKSSNGTEKNIERIK
jgi:hypothetical protein